MEQNKNISYKSQAIFVYEAYGILENNTTIPFIFSTTKDNTEDNICENELKKLKKITKNPNAKIIGVKIVMTIRFIRKLNNAKEWK